MQPVGRPDPAPSRWAWRMQRLMLTPGIRLLLRAGIPAVVVFAATTAWLSDAERRDAILSTYRDLRASIEERPEFTVTAMAVDGAGESVAADIREVVPLDFPVSSFDLDLENIRATVTGLDPVREASVRIRPGGILQIDVVERLPVLLWRTHDGLELLDEGGVHVGIVGSRAERPDLPVVAGEGADRQVAEALALFAAAAPLQDRLRGLVRMGERRWDVVLDRGQRILLPETRPVQALERVIALSAAHEMFDRDLIAVDMRVAERPALRMSAEAVTGWRRIRDINGWGH